MSKLRLGVSPVTDRVYAGKMNSDGIFFKGHKHDVTNDFLHAVVMRWNGYQETITAGDKEYIVSVKEVK